MIHRLERQKDILKLITQLDITPSMYQNAVEKYKAIAAFLEDCDIEADIYPQGSFAFGTVIKPSSKDSNASYDLDFICQLNLTKNEITPSELYKQIEQAFKSSNRYEGKLKVCEKCFTVEYADINNVSFSIDIVPAVAETFEQISNLQKNSNRPDLLSTAIAIPRYIGNHNYQWITNNPKGFKTWFDEINKPYLDSKHREIRSAVFEAHREIYNSVEDVPPAMERSAMQRVIQILKYHRDTYYANLKPQGHDELKPISAIINTLVAEISKTAFPTLSVFELLAFVLNELNIYAELLKISTFSFTQKYSTRVVITRNNGKWVISNPANPNDNLADKWNTDPDIPRTFFRWINACYYDLIESLNLPDDKFRTQIENAFGTETIRKNWGSKYSVATPKPINIAMAAKPYGAM